jgi:cytoskeletal protein CcmA (bactofilin family)
MFSRRKDKDKAKQAAPQADISKSQPTRKSGSGIPSIISSDLKVLGNIVSDGVVDIDGIVEGNVKCHTATVRKNGHIKGDVVAEVVHVYGRIQGLIKARNVQFFKGCRAEGVIMHESITIEDGAFVDGRFKRTEHLSLDESEGEKVDVATLPADEPKKLFGHGAATFEDESLKTPSFMTDADDEEDEETEIEGKKRKRAKKESVMDNLRLISDVN